MVHDSLKSNSEAPIRGSAAAMTMIMTAALTLERCANPRCWYTQHSTKRYGAFCCGKCRNWHSNDCRKTQHGPSCEHVLCHPDAVTPTLTPAPPDHPPPRPSAPKLLMPKYKVPLTKTTGPPPVLAPSAHPPIMTASSKRAAAPPVVQPKMRGEANKRLRADRLRPTFEEREEQVQQAIQDAQHAEAAGFPQDATVLRFRAMLRSTITFRGDSKEDPEDVD